MGARIWIAAVIVAAGCSDKKDAGAEHRGKAKVALELTGAITLSMSGEDGQCNAGAGGMKQARSFSIHADQLGAPDGFNLDLNALTDGAGAEGAAFVRLGDAQFQRTSGSSVTVTEANLFTVDSTLEEQGGDRKLVVKGTVQCP